MAAKEGPRDQAHPMTPKQLAGLLVRLARLADGVLHGEIASEARTAAAQLEAMVPGAWGCHTCDKFDWNDDRPGRAQPEHVSYRGVELRSWRGRMIPLYAFPDQEVDR